MSYNNITPPSLFTDYTEISERQQLFNKLAKFSLEISKITEEIREAADDGVFLDDGQWDEVWFIDENVYTPLCDAETEIDHFIRMRGPEKEMVCDEVLNEEED